ncbi:MAG: hypothetical protein IJ946_04910 [Clostridia bacterium]|nr:hypothetical protein [Clostridia bacterium]
MSENNSSFEELKIEEQETENEEKNKSFSKSDWLKRFLTPECITAFFLSVMSIIISIVSLSTDKTSRNIAAKELEILTNDREAYFTVNTTSDGYKNNDKEFVLPFLIKNEGGRISGASVSVSSHIKVMMTLSGIQKQEVNGKVVSKADFYQVLFVIPVKDLAYLDKESYKAYDQQSKSFKVYERYPNNFFDFLDLIEEKICINDERLTAACARFDELEIRYCNFENVSKKVVYNLGTDYMSTIPENWKDEYTEKNIKVITIGHTFDSYTEETAQSIADYLYYRFNFEKNIYDKSNKAQAS